MANIQKAPQATKHKLPTIAELYSDVELASKFNDLNRIVNHQPKKEWIKVNEQANNSQYIPIEIVEYLLTSIYGVWRVEIKSVQMIANSSVVTIRLWVRNPMTGEWDYQDGVGAFPIHTKKGASATDFANVNTASVQMSVPAAESLAIKDAADKLGKIFGKDLNRKNAQDYEAMHERMAQAFKKNEPEPLPEELIAVIKSKADKEELKTIWNANPEFHDNPEFFKLIQEQKAIIDKTPL